MGKDNQMNELTTSPEQAVIPPDKGKRKRLPLILIVTAAFVALIVIGVFLWFTTLSPCTSKKVVQTNEELSSLYANFIDASNLAMATPRLALASQISNMQDIKNETDDLVVPPCLEYAQDLLSDGMDDFINGFITFLGEGDTDTIADYFDSGLSKMNLAVDEMQSVEDCAPFCTADPYRLVP
jgi:hypothetical protein